MPTTLTLTPMPIGGVVCSEGLPCSSELPCSDGATLTVTSVTATSLTLPSE